MVYGFGRGFNRGGGSGFGFRGASPDWPYVGRGRGGLPRCQHPGAGRRFAPYSAAETSFSPRMTPEEELHSLKNQAEAIRAELGRVEARINNLEATKK